MHKLKPTCLDMRQRILIEQQESEYGMIYESSTDRDQDEIKEEEKKKK